ncbi:CKLF-like MARVEL transmembrane domain-containing protein 4 [Argiope bruennichi]|uniref:CKLF-like MARVEL transmembrane n=1 Tax=Argiope bruennichi TaxID=94029 RepID=A0A8T0E9E8_ARGBR|nr:CKLF-like MARVEL transmembrane domain-containing protein 4 [Argiope bruennichi]XP_055937125.1 CKLF-like MARVEL transmembrane domain-containing protein 4 [Argiope bruennichi]XP_055937126.1 CKLF-like MARVEL transmembrane domain-containing protein 4 [Argiope bruennichi]KAF8768469.1 CKLF-like MARVEL transmembrane [Argiope bruennichi]
MATVTVSATTTTKVSPNIRFDPSYAKTIPGILKIAQAVVSLIGFICIQMASGDYYSRSASGWFIFVAMTAFWVVLVLLVLYLFHIIEKLHWIPWLLGELGFTALWTVFYFIAACVVVAKAGEDAGWGAGAFFGFVGMALFGYDAFTKYKLWRSGAIAQGERTTTTSTSPTPTGPSYPTY